MHAQKMSQQLQGALTEMRARPSLATIQEKLEERDRALSRVLHLAGEKAAEETKVQAAYIAELRAQLLDFTRHQAGIEKKVSIALRFMDWFIDVKCKGSTFDRSMGSVFDRPAAGAAGS